MNLICLYCRIYNHNDIKVVVLILADMRPAVCDVLWFPQFCEEFLNKHLGYTIYPIRFNGSAIETFFSQLKFATSRHLSATNYASAQVGVLTRGSVKGKHKHTEVYGSTCTMMS